MSGLGMLSHVIYVYMRMRRLTESMKFITIILVLLTLKSLSLITEAALWLLLFDDNITSFWRFVMSNVAEFVNWTST